MASKRELVGEKVHQAMANLDWMAAIREMERLFTVGRDPHIRIKIGDLWRKLNRMQDAVREYLYAAELFAQEGFTNKAMAQYALALRLDASNEYARRKRESLRARRSPIACKREPMEYLPPRLSERDPSAVHAA